ncbi:MAG: hypothetical protein Q7U64_11165 [Desulfocapsaceae bacterium]|jgi:hypothetical protein|nr:hypothetical protein [Desulfocapsaceae bacterium]
MGITKDYQVLGNRIFFRCPGCGAKRTYSIAHDLRQISIRCYKCGDKSMCRLNRRFCYRSQQAGKVLLITQEGREFEINLNDISVNGVGFDVPIGIARAKVVSLGEEVRFRCSWNPQLLGSSRFVVQNVRGQRVGAKKRVL